MMPEPCYSSAETTPGNPNDSTGKLSPIFGGGTDISEPPAHFQTRRRNSEARWAGSEDMQEDLRPPAFRGLTSPSIARRRSNPDEYSYSPVQHNRNKQVLSPPPRRSCSMPLDHSTTLHQQLPPHIYSKEVEQEISNPPAFRTIETCAIKTPQCSAGGETHDRTMTRKKDDTSLKGTERSRYPRRSSLGSYNRRKSSLGHHRRRRSLVAFKKMDSSGSNRSFSSFSSVSHDTSWLLSERQKEKEQKGIPFDRSSCYDSASLSSVSSAFVEESPSGDSLSTGIGTSSLVSSSKMGSSEPIPILDDSLTDLSFAAETKSKPFDRKISEYRWKATGPTSASAQDLLPPAFRGLTSPSIARKKGIGDHNDDEENGKDATNHNEKKLTDEATEFVIDNGLPPAFAQSLISHRRETAKRRGSTGATIPATCKEETKQTQSSEMVPFSSPRLNFDKEHVVNVVSPSSVTDPNMHGHRHRHRHHHHHHHHDAWDDERVLPKARIAHHQRQSSD